MTTLTSRERPESSGDPKPVLDGRRALGESALGFGFGFGVTVGSHRLITRRDMSARLDPAAPAAGR